MAFQKGHKRVGGKKKGSLHKHTKELKDMILGALDKAGGEAYLVKQAKENPTAFMTLIGKTLPLALKPDGEGKFSITWES